MRSRVNGAAPLSFSVKRYWPCGIRPRVQDDGDEPCETKFKVLPGWAWPAGGGVEALVGLDLRDLGHGHLFLHLDALSQDFGITGSDEDRTCRVYFAAGSIMSAS